VSRAYAHRFSSEEEACRVALRCNGPWYSVPAPESIEVLDAHYYPPVPARLELV
jgi:hypothetical protein